MTSEKPKLKISRCRHDTGRTFIETIEEETLIATITDPSSEMWQLAQQLVSVWNAQCNLLAESVQGENNAHMEALRAGQVADETITDLRSQLHAATARAEEAEHDLKLARESDANHEALWKQGAAERIALEAQVSELERVIENLRGWITANAKTSIHGLLEYTDNTVRRKPDLPLIEEVREALSKCVVQLHHIRGGYILGTKIDEAHDAATQLLARLNPTKL